MAKTAPAFAQLSLFDTTALTSPFGLFGGGSGGLLPALGGDDEDDTPVAPIAPAIPRVVARDFRLAGDRGLAAEGPCVVEVDMVSVGPFAESFAGPPAGAAGSVR